MINFIFSSSQPLIFVVLLDFISLSTGLFLLRNIRFLPLNIKACASLGAGFFFLSVTIFLEGISGILYREIIVADLALLFAAAVFFFFKYAKEFRKSAALSTSKLPLVSILLSLAPLFTICMLPPTARDELVYHLAAPKLYLKHHMIFNIEGNIFAAFPSFTEMLYTIPLALGYESSARLLHLNFCILSSVTLYFFAQEYLSKDYSLLAAFFLASSPVVFSISGTAYIDISFVFYVLLSFIFINFWMKSRDKIVLLVFSGIFAGCAMAIKYTGMWVALIMLTMVLLFSRSFIPAGIFLLSSFAVVSLWYIKNYLFTGNPFYPFLYSLFGGKGWDSYREAIYLDAASRFFTGSGWIHYLLFPITFPLGLKPQQSGYFGFDGTAGLIFTLMIPAAIYLGAVGKLREKCKYILLFFFLFFLIWFFTSTQTRLFLPAFPVALIIIMVSIQEISEKRKIIKLTTLIFLACSIAFNLYHDINFLKENVSTDYLFGKQTRRQYLLKKIPLTYPAIEFINTKLEPSAKIWLVWMKNQGYYLERDYYSDSFYESATMEYLLSDKSTLNNLLSFLSEKGITHMLINENLFLSSTPFDTEDRKKDMEKKRERFLRFSKKYLAIMWQDGGIVLYSLRLPDLKQ